MKLYIDELYGIIETKDIFQIYDFRPPKCGFSIHFINNTHMEVISKELFDEEPNEDYYEHKEYYDLLRKKIERYWARDKTEVVNLTWIND